MAELRVPAAELPDGGGPEGPQGRKPYRGTVRGPTAGGGPDRGDVTQKVMPTCPVEGSGNDHSSVYKSLATSQVREGRLLRPRV